MAYLKFTFSDASYNKFAFEDLKCIFYFLNEHLQENG